MAGKKNRRRQVSADWYANGTDESDTNASGDHKSPDPEGEGGESIGNGQTESPNGDGRSRDGKRASPQHPKHKATLGPWTHAVDEAVQGMNTAQRAIKNLQGVFTAHMDDLSRIDDLKRRVNELEGECNEKDEVVKSHATTISTLRAMDHEAKAGIEDQLKQIAKEKEELKEERTKLKRRVEAATAEEQFIMQRDFEERVARHDKTHETRMKELEVEFDQKRQENSKKAAALETEQGRLLTETKQQQKTIKGQVEELERLKDQYDTLDRAKTSFKREKENLERELGTMKEDFAVDTKPPSYLYIFLYVYKKKLTNLSEHEFEEIYRQIKGLSLKYFHDIEEKVSMLLPARHEFG